MDIKDYLRIITDSNPNDWIFNDSHSVYRYNNCLDVSIKLEFDFENPVLVNAAWANSFHTPRQNVATEIRVFLMYKDDIKRSYYGACADSGNIYLLEPRQMEYDGLMYHINKILTEAQGYRVRGRNKLDNYLRMAKIKVDFEANFEN